MVESLPLQEALIPLADQPKPNAPPRVSRLKRVLSQLDGRNLRKERNNGKENEKEKVHKEDVLWLWG